MRVPSEQTTPSTIAPPGFASPAVPLPSFEGDFQLPEDLLLDCGESLAAPVLHYATYGRLNAARDNAVLVAHALSGSARVADWWPRLIVSRETPEGLLDLDRHFVIGINFLGSCYGSTGPGSVNPRTDRAYGVEFPLIGIRDIVRSQRQLLESLGIVKLRLVIGASIGGMQAIEWAACYPDGVATAVAIAAAPLGAMGLALNHLQRKMIKLDPLWQNGRYSSSARPAEGLAAARALAVCSYKSADLLNERFARNPNRSASVYTGGEAAGEDPWSPSGGRFDVGGFLDYQGKKFVERFDANSYLAITRTMDTFDPLRGRGSWRATYGGSGAHIIMVGISSDWLFPPAEVRAMAEAISAAGAWCKYREMISSHGHDAFLAEPEQLSRILAPLIS